MPIELASPLPWARFEQDLPEILALDSVCQEEFYRKLKKHRETTIQKVTSEFSSKILGVVVYLALPDKFEVRRLLANRFSTTFEQLIRYMTSKLQRDKARTQLVIHDYETSQLHRDLIRHQLLRKAGFQVTKQEKDEDGNIRYVFVLIKG